jgi:hypothetical protein
MKGSEWKKTKGDIATLKAELTAQLDFLLLNKKHQVLRRQNDY